MYSYEDRIRCVKLYLKLSKRLKATICQVCSMAGIGLAFRRTEVRLWALYRTPRTASDWH
jgi:hypothetical protein